jgi:mycoredoxin
MADEKVELRVYGASWCPDARRSRRLLDHYRIPYTWLDIDADSDAKEFVRRTNGGSVVIPTIVFPDGSILVEPPDQALSEKLGLKAEPD